MGWTAKHVGMMEVSDSCQVHLDGVGLKYLAAISSKETDGVLGPRYGGQIEFGTEWLLKEPWLCGRGGLLELCGHLDGLGTSS